MQSVTPGADPIAPHWSTVRARLLDSGLARAGPGSVTWKINREIVVVAAWGRAILLQLAHPAIADALHHHSTFRGSIGAALARLTGTVRSMLSITFGDADRMITAAARINAIHDRVRAAGYSAHDAALQRWVHATLLASTLDTYERFVGPLSSDERNRYCAEAAIMEPLLGLPSGLLPRSSAELTTYMEDMLAGGSLHVTEISRALADAVLSPPQWYFAWPAFRPLQLMTIGSLPQPIRHAYGFAWRPRDERALARWTTGIRLVLRLVPRIAREWPIRYATTAITKPS